MCRGRRTPYIHHPPRATREGDEKEKQTTEKLTGRAKREQAGERALLHLRNWYLQLCRAVCACACIYICMSFTLLLPLNTARAGVYDLTAYLPGYGKRLLCFSIPGFCSSILCLRVGVGVLLVCICCFLSVTAGASSVLLFLPPFFCLLAPATVCFSTFLVSNCPGCSPSFCFFPFFRRSVCLCYFLPPSLRSFLRVCNRVNGRLVSPGFFALLAEWEKIVVFVSPSSPFSSACSRIEEDADGREGER